MRNNLSILFFIVSFGAIAQMSPGNINYQAAIRDANGALITNTSVNFQFSVISNSSTGNIVFQETQSSTSNDFGLVNLKIGNGTPVIGSISAVDWSAGPYSFKVEMDASGGTNFSLFGVSDISSVPYSLFADKAATVDSVSINQISDLPNLSISNDTLFYGSLGSLYIDGSVTNEIQDLQLNGDTLSISLNPSATKIDLSGYLDNTNLTEAQVDSFANNNGYLLTEVDGSITNEIQDLTISSNSLSITGNTSATSIDLSGYLDNTNLTEAQVDSFANNNGYLLTEVDGSITNEIQDLSIAANSLSITGNTSATSIDLSGYLDNTVLTEAQVDSFANNNGYLLTEIDGSVTNEIQNIEEVLTTGNDANGKDLVDLGNVAIGSQSADASALLDVSSTTQGLLPPRMTQVQRNAISNPAAGLIVWCTDCGTNGLFSGYNGTGWADLSLTSTAGTVPTVTTDAITSYGFSSATLGGNVLSNGGASILSRGVCYSSSPNPNISDNITTVTTGTGAFNDFVIGLDSNTTYYARAYATNSNGIAYGNQVTFTSKGLVSIGDFYQGGKVFYILQGGDKDYVPGEQHGLIALPFDYYATLPWSSCNSLVSTTTYIGDGDFNTNNIVDSCNINSPLGAAQMAQTNTSYGYSDWFLPSIDELVKAFANRAAAGLNLSALASDYYWSSTQSTQNPTRGALVRLVNGNTVQTAYGLKTQNSKVRIIRKF